MIGIWAHLQNTKFHKFRKSLTLANVAVFHKVADTTGQIYKKLHNDRYATALSLWQFKISSRQIGVRPPGTTKLTSIHYGDVKWPSWRLELPAIRTCVQQFVRVTVPLWGESTMIGGFPAQRDSNAENISTRWHHNGLKDAMMAHITQYAHCITAIKHNRRVRFLGTITLSVKNSETAYWYLPPAGCGRWAHKVTNYLKILQGKLLKFSPDSNRIRCTH